jgi:hypothetical protein
MPILPTVSEYLATITDEVRLADATQIIAMMQSVAGEEPVMWYPSILGFGSYKYKYASGHEGETMKMGLSARKEHLVLYGIIFYDRGTELLEKLGKHKHGKGCLYIKKLSDVNLEILETMIRNAWESPAPTVP